jgi:ribosome maturation factor RimP
MTDARPDARLARETGPAARIVALAEPVLESMGFRLVRVKMFGPVVQIMAERPDGTFTIDDCENFSRAFSPMMDVADIVSARYQLEVSSPGIDRPLVRAADFENWAGHEVKIEMAVPQAGRKRFKGDLEGYADGEVRIYIENPEKGSERILIGVPFADIAEAKLTLTDELIEAAQEKLKASGVGDASDFEGDINPVTGGDGQPVTEDDDDDEEEVKHG